MWVSDSRQGRPDRGPWLEACANVSQPQQGLSAVPGLQSPAQAGSGAGSFEEGLGVLRGVINDKLEWWDLAKEEPAPKDGSSFWTHQGQRHGVIETQILHLGHRWRLGLGNTAQDQVLLIRKLFSSSTYCVPDTVLRIFICTAII